MQLSVCGIDKLKQSGCAIAGCSVLIVASSFCVVTTAMTDAAVTQLCVVVPTLSCALQDLDWFWEMIGEMGDEQRRELLCFWTSMSTVPAGMLHPTPYLSICLLLNI